MIGLRAIGIGAAVLMTPCFGFDRAEAATVKVVATGTVLSGTDGTTNPWLPLTSYFLGDTNLAGESFELSFLYDTLQGDWSSPMTETSTSGSIVAAQAASAFSLTINGVTVALEGLAESFLSTSVNGSTSSSRVLAIFSSTANEIKSTGLLNMDGLNASLFTMTDSSPVSGQMTFQLSQSEASGGTLLARTTGTLQLSSLSIAVQPDPATEETPAAVPLPASIGLLLGAFGTLPLVFRRKAPPRAGGAIDMTQGSSAT